MSTPASVCSACWDITHSSSTAQKKRLRASGCLYGNRPTHFTKIGSYELHCNPDIFTPCKNACEESTSEAPRPLTEACGGLMCWKYSSAILSAAGSCICNFNVKNLCDGRSLQDCHIQTGDPVEMVMLVCLVLLDVWAHRSLFVTSEELNQKDRHFWNGDFPLHTHTHSFFFFLPLSPLAQGH